ncbi:hypothetical protein [Stenotrophomonas sp.]|uniref:hypothetical protein n=1 Tax=Stenotrophomonas sp. TaxID=69392 RepID=UPI0028B00DDE|nr:hypothetical protein [Stenotrophomonas sp.]
MPDYNEVEVLKQALKIACERIADGPQRYHEANTPEGWCDVFVQRAKHRIDAFEHPIVVNAA